MKFVEWKWSNGEKAERTPRPPPIQNRTQNVELDGEYNSYEVHDENQVVNRCLTSAEDMLGLREIMDQGQQHLMNEFHRQPNKREDTYNRMAEREMVGQRGMNPFFSQTSDNNSGYIEDLMNQEQFMKPISTSMEREK
jgi:archaellum component FlaC